MKRIWVATALVVAPVASILCVSASSENAGWISRANAQPANSASAQPTDLSAKEAFAATKELGTIEAWNTFLANYPTGFYADLARAYVKKLTEAESRPVVPTEPAPDTAVDAPEAPSPDVTAPRQVPVSEPVPPVPSQPGVAPVAATIDLGPNADLKGIRLLPPDSPWNRDISRDPVDPRSRKILARAGLDTPLHPDFGGDWDGVPIGIPYIVVANTQPKVPVQFEVADESDKGPYPIPANAPIEGGPKADGDRHVIVLNRDTMTVYELYNAFNLGKPGWKADSGAIWNLLQNQVRPHGFTSADAAGLPILPGLVRHDEVVGKKSVEHALRFTLAKTRRAYVPPASHWASDLTDDDLPPMGMRVRLKANFDLAGFSPEARVILTGLKKYGMVLADNGSNFFISGTNDKRWNADAIAQLKRVTAKDLEVIEMKGLVTSQ